MTRENHFEIRFTHPFDLFRVFTLFYGWPRIQYVFIRSAKALFRLHGYTERHLLTKQLILRKKNETHICVPAFMLLYKHIYIGRQLSYFILYLFSVVMTILFCLDVPYSDKTSNYSEHHYIYTTK